MIYELLKDIDVLIHLICQSLMNLQPIKVAKINQLTYPKVKIQPNFNKLACYIFFV